MSKGYKWLLAIGYWLLAAQTKKEKLTIINKLPKARSQRPKAETETETV